MGHQSPTTFTLSRSAVSESKVQPLSAKDQIAALKMRAKESVMAKRAQSIRSTSNDSNVGRLDGFEYDLTQDGRYNNGAQADEPESKTYEPNSKAQATSFGSNGGMASQHSVPAKAISMELEDLLAEGRAAASLSKPKNEQFSSPSEQFPKHGDGQHCGEPDKSETGEIREDGSHQDDDAAMNGGTPSQMKNFASADIDDIDAWLAMTGYYDKPYRNKVLGRRKRLREIEAEKLRLLEEEDEDQRNRSHFHSGTALVAVEGASPHAVMVRPSAPPANQDLGLRIKDSASKKKSVREESKTNREVKGKRRMDEDTTDTEGRPQSKAARTEAYHGTPSRSQRTSPERQANGSVSPEKHRRVLTAPVRKQTSPVRDGYDRWVPDKQADETGPAARSRYDFERFERRNEDRGRPDQRLDSEFSRSNSQKPESHAPKARFFLLKSWNYENIAIAQHEGTWATQTKNEDIFVEAFQTCRDVIFFFSANHSKAFQGYARMQGLPGERGVSQPSWVKNLHWPTTAPFRLKWIVKEETPYRAVGNLKNPLNENLAVFVGRDGQEIPEKMGHQLCDIIDEDTAYRGKFRR